jgi:hypothetical protein
LQWELVRGGLPFGVIAMGKAHFFGMANSMADVSDTSTEILTSSVTECVHFGLWQCGSDILFAECDK